MDISRILLDFSKKPPLVKMTEFHPELLAFKEFINQKDDDIIKIAILMTDPESPFLKIKDRETMVSSIFEYLGIDLEGEKYKGFFDDIVNYRHEEIGQCKARCLQIVHNVDWTEYVMTRETFDYLTMEANKPMSADDETDQYINRRVKLKDQIKKAGIDLKSMEARIFPDSRSARETAILDAKRKITSFPERYSQERSVI